MPSVGDTIGGRKVKIRGTNKFLGLIKEMLVAVIFIVAVAKFLQTQFET